MTTRMSREQARRELAVYEAQGREDAAARRSGREPRRIKTAEEAEKNDAELRAEVTREGARVRVKIADWTAYARGCADALNGRTGRVARVKTDHSDGLALLVEFDRPVPGWHAHQSDVTGFWFPPGDLESEGDAMVRELTGGER